ncbi:putative hydrolases or acyltransferase [Boeremia exigua]|uniref:putative hydrolases or acyltransferase n=1 Tax=Boeremia exigua TaxID=749465 RepID=UPI001E8CCBF3|nr:putative hydrolases or acyltransferase [Boeremia exigua]KAH6629591.1 putative hydrolases or acyltransferase [Boeremia exigua]
MLGKVLASSLLVSSALAYPADTTHPNTTLEWAPCDLDFPASSKEAIAKHAVPLFCATLSVPLDYTEPENGKTIDLQLIKIKATKEPFKGSILTNPGGPGGSGVEFVAIAGPEYTAHLGGFHDVIGFDPRGTGRTIPFDCTPSNTTASKVKRGQYNFTIPQNDAYGELQRKLWDEGGVFAEDCANTPGNADIGPYIGTAFVARDMLSIIDALGEEKLQYWGISYGTFLGQTFAGMFPDRVGRVLLDSSFDFEDYHNGQWIPALRDTERAMVNGFTECVNAGPTLCPLANLTGPDTTADDIHKELAKVFQELIDEPVYFPDDWSPKQWLQPGGIPIFTVLKSMLLTLSYSAVDLGSLYLAVEIALQRDWERAISVASAFLNSTSPEIPWNLGSNAFHGIACADGAFQAETPEDMYSWIQAQTAVSTFGDTFGTQMWPCAQWKFEAKERYTGPWNAINTSYPILFISGSHDPITPLSSGYEASANFPGSRMLVHNGHGHAVMNHPSACTIKAIADYFNEGTLPGVGTVCQPDKTAFEVYVDFVAELQAEVNSTLTKRAYQNIRTPVFA